MRPSNDIVSLVMGLVAAIGCAHGQSAARSADAFRAFACPPDGVSDAQAFGRALTPAVDVQYVEVISEGGGHDAVIVAERGAKCSGATNAAACDAELSRLKQAWLRARPRCEDCRGATLVLTTRGDEVAQRTRPDEIVSLLGAIDSPAEAWLLLMVRDGGPPYTCGDPSVSGYRVSSDGIELSRQEWTSTCRPVERVEIVESFARNGAARTLRRTVVEREMEACFVP
jgi:hypothetical protein